MRNSPPAISDHSQLHCDIQDLLDQANIGLLVGISDKAAARALVVRMRDCAVQASSANLPKSAHLLRGAADVVEQWLQDQSEV
jgi:hypothetical protein